MGVNSVCSDMSGDYYFFFHHPDFRGASIKMYSSVADDLFVLQTSCAHGEQRYYFAKGSALAECENCGFKAYVKGRIDSPVASLEHWELMDLKTGESYWRVCDFMAGYGTNAEIQPGEQWIKS